MTARSTRPSARRTRGILGHRHLPARPGSSPNAEIVERDRLQRRVDPAALRHQGAPLRRRRRDRRRRWRSPRAGKALAARRHRRRRRSTASSSPPSRTCCRPRPSRPRSPHELGADNGRPRSTSPPPAPASATASRSANDMVRGGSAKHVLVIGVERLSDFTDLDDRGTAFIFADGAGAAVVGPVRRARHRPGRLGLRRRAVRR